MIVLRATFLELFSPFAISLGVMTAMLMLEKAYKLMQLVVENRLRTSELGLMLAFLTPQVLTITLPLAVVVGVFVTVIRHSTESELIALKATGRSLWNYSLAFVAFGLIALGVTAAFTLLIQPSSYRRYTDLQLDMIRYRAEEKIIPGEFNYDFGEKVILVGGRKSKREFTSIFIADKVLRLNSAIIAADRGAIVVDQDARRVIFQLETGHIYVADAVPEIIRVVDFENLNYTLDFRPTDKVETNTSWGLTTPELIRDLNDPALDRTRRDRRSLELVSRISIPLACLAFAVASLPMAIVDPRSRRSGGFVRAIFLVVTYYLVWIGFNDLAYSGNAPSIVLVIPPFLILTYGIFRIWSVNSDVSSLWQLIRRARRRQPKN